MNTNVFNIYNNGLAKFLYDSAFNDFVYKIPIDRKYLPNPTLAGNWKSSSTKVLNRPGEAIH
jgi:hypothetical protein